MTEIILPTDARARHKALHQLDTFLKQLGDLDSWKVTVAKYKPTRSTQQNAYLWRIYEIIIEQAGLEGWSKDDLHEYFLGEHFGWVTLEGMGRKRVKPAKRSSRLSTAEFSAYVEFIQRTCAERFGIVIPDPE